MTAEELCNQLLGLGVSCRVHGDEVVVETCRFCDNIRWNLELNPRRGLYHCWACDAGGRLDRLLQEWLGQEIYLPVRWNEIIKLGKPQETPAGFVQLPAYEVPSAARYLARRHVDAQTARHYELGVCATEQHRLAGRLVLPLRDFWTGALVGYLGRSYAGQQPKYISTLSSRQVATGYRVRQRESPCVIVEGPFDGIAIHRAGFHAAILIGTAAPWVLEFAARLPPTTPLVIMLDGDAFDEARRLYWTIFRVRTEVPPQISVLPAGTDPAHFTPSVLRSVVRETLEDGRGR
jgi:DNA primase